VLSLIALVGLKLWLWIGLVEVELWIGLVVAGLWIGLAESELWIGLAESELWIGLAESELWIGLGEEGPMSFELWTDLVVFQPLESLIDLHATKPLLGLEISLAEPKVVVECPELALVGLEEAQEC
jgi:hypothetical protein